MRGYYLGRDQKPDDDSEHMRAIPILQFLVSRLLTVVITLFIITAIIYGIVLLAPVESRAQLYMGSHIRMNLPQEIQMR